MRIYDNLIHENGLLNNEIITPDSLIIQGQENEISYNYYIFDSINEFEKYYFSLPKFCRNFYEVILDGPQKLRFDIDIKGIKVHEIKEPLSLVMDFKLKLEEKLNTEVLIYISNDIEKKKFSCHLVILGYYAKNHEECFSLCYALRELADEILIPYIDFSVYKKIQSFRLEGSTKYGDIRFKYLYGCNDISSRFEDSLIGNTDNCVLITPTTIINKSVLKKSYNNCWSYNYL